MDNIKILVVDDEARMRKLVKDFLSIKGYQVLEAGDGEEAVDLFFQQKDIALILLDVMMPKMDGWEVVKTIRKYSQVPIIMLTARGEESDELQGFNLGGLVVSYLQSQGVEQLEYVFCSHAHEDHVGGLAAALACFPACHVYSPVTEASTKCFKDFVKYTQQQNLQVEVPAVGTQWALGSATVTMLGPVAQYEDTNDTSIVLRIDYGATSFLLTGDMESDAERDLVNSGANLKVDVLQVGHHGSSTSTSYVFLNAVLPEMGIISCGANNKYGHPHEETLSILRDAGVDVYRTDLLGTITVSSDGQNYTVATEHFATDAELNPTAPAASSAAQQAYIGNVNSKKFHLPSCANLPAEKNQILFSSYDEAVAAGYSPCSSCIK